MGSLIDITDISSAKRRLVSKIKLSRWHAYSPQNFCEPLQDIIQARFMVVHGAIQKWKVQFTAKKGLEDLWDLLLCYNICRLQKSWTPQPECLLSDAVELLDAGQEAHILYRGRQRLRVVVVRKSTYPGFMRAFLLNKITPIQELLTEGSFSRSPVSSPSNLISIQAAVSSEKSRGMEHKIASSGVSGFE